MNTKHNYKTAKALIALDRGWKSRLIYLAGPIAVDPDLWFTRAVSYFDLCVKWAKRRQLNINFFVPHFSITGEKAAAQETSVWLGIDGAILRCSSAVLELPPIDGASELNVSSGRDAERVLAQTRKIPWFVGQNFDPAKENPNDMFAVRMSAGLLR